MTSNSLICVLFSVLWPLSLFSEQYDLNKARDLGKQKSHYLNSEPSEDLEIIQMPKADLESFKKVIAPILKKNCQGCHGPEKTKGNFRADKLEGNLLESTDIDKWVEVYEVLSNSEMPPEDEPDYHITDKQRKQFIDWLSTEMKKASQVQQNKSRHTSFKRMNKYEYNNVLQDLLGVKADFANELPPETISEDGFKNNSELLQMTPSQFETYRKSGLRALKKAYITEDQPKPLYFNFELQEALNYSKNDRRGTPIDSSAKDFSKSRKRPHIIDSKTGKGYTGRHLYVGGWDYSKSNNDNKDLTLVLPRYEFVALELGSDLPDKGILQIRIKAGRTTFKKNDFVSLAIDFSDSISVSYKGRSFKNEFILPVKASVTNPEYIQFEVNLNEIKRSPFRKPMGLNSLKPTKKGLTKKQKERHRNQTSTEFLIIKSVSSSWDKPTEEPLEIHIDQIEILSPVFKNWPPKSHSNIFINSPNKTNEKVYAQEVINNFIARAWRRSVAKEEIKPYLNLFDTFRPEFTSFEETIIEVLATALAAPEFLYLSQNQSEEFNDYDIAERLSFFLWSSLPDNELLNLAKQGKLKSIEVINSQIERMLNDEKAKRFIKTFSEEWLGLGGLDSISVDKKHHYLSEGLRVSMKKEISEFFNEVLVSNSNVLDFIHSDYAVLNKPLSRHYNIHTVHGLYFRKVPVHVSKKRGGILTAGGILTMNSDGKDSHPLRRGIWLLERILQDPPPPPPPNVPEVDLTDPKILKMTLKERLADHRNHAACKSCHQKIDPWGIAFENYNAIGKFRTQINKKPVDSSATLFNKQKLNGIQGLKYYLLTERQDQFIRALIHKMTSYAVGRPLTFSDRAEIDRMATELRKKGDGLRELIPIIVNSKIFQSK